MTQYRNWHNTLESYSQNPPEHVWKNLESRIALHNSRRRLKVTRIFAIAATFALVLLSSIAIYSIKGTSFENPDYAAGITPIYPIEADALKHGIYAVENVQAWSRAALTFYGD